MQNCEAKVLIFVKLVEQRAYRFEENSGTSPQSVLRTQSFFKFSKRFEQMRTMTR